MDGEVPGQRSLRDSNARDELESFIMNIVARSQSDDVNISALAPSATDFFRALRVIEPAWSLSEKLRPTSVRPLAQAVSAQDSEAAASIMQCICTGQTYFTHHTFHSDEFQLKHPTK